MRLKTLYAVILSSCIALICEASRPAQDELLTLRKEVSRLREENKILKDSWDSCVDEYHKLMIGG